MTSRTQVKFQLYDMDGKAITASGGVVYVAATEDAAKNAITDKDGTALTNPRALTAGGCEFWVLATVAEVDLYIQAPGGQFIVVPDVVPGTIQNIKVDTAQRNQTYIIPFSISDTSAATETDTGFDVPAASFVLDRLHGMGIRQLTADATETIDVGLLSTETGGDANGFNAAAALDATPLMLVGTNGALFSSNAPHASDFNVSKSISYTLTAGTDTAEGFIILPILLTAT